MPAHSVAALFAYCLDILLYGILTTQTYIYYLAFPNDRRMLKVVVAFVYAVGTVQTAFALHDFYMLFCPPNGNDTSRGDPSLKDPILYLPRFGFMWLTIPVSSALVAVVSQLFYAHRIHTISKNKKITGVVIALAFLQLGCGMTSAAIFYGRATRPFFPLAGFVGKIVNGILWGSTGAICDFFIAIYMFRFLSSQMNRASRPTQVSLTRLKRLLLETGLLTTVTASAYILLSMFTLDLFMIPGLSLSKLYGNSILALLNNRLTVPGGRNAPRSEFDIPSIGRSAATESYAE